MPATENYPWTDTQIDRAVEAGNRHLCEFDRDDIRELLRGFREAGITVDIPEPRYAVREGSGGVHFQVAPPGDLTPAVASFFGGPDGHPDPEGAAKAEAHRLNRPGEGVDFGELVDEIDGLEHERDKALAEVRDLKLRQAGDAGQIVGLRYRAEVAEGRADRFEKALRSIAAVDRRTAGGEGFALLSMLREVGETARDALGRLADKT
jgi:hypothetical protein